MGEHGNADQIAYWNADAGEVWAVFQQPLDAQLEPHGLKAIEALAPRAGERIVDVGCGAGQTSLALAQAIGSIVGCDISQPLLAMARRRAADAGLDNVSFIEADVQTHIFSPSIFDAVFSRFGVMFFADPPLAFVNVRRGLRPGGRLAFVCWRAPAENMFMTLPYEAARAHLPPAPEFAPAAPGPFAFAEPDQVRQILVTAGFRNIELVPFDEQIGGGNLEQTLAVSLEVGLLGRALREHPERRELVVDHVREALRSHVDVHGNVRLGSASWIVTARN